MIPRPYYTHQQPEQDESSFKNSIMDTTRNEKNHVYQTDFNGKQQYTFMVCGLGTVGEEADWQIE